MLEVRVRKQRGDWRLDAEFSMPTPGIVALFGRSGCGKSTLVDIIAGLVAADAGRVALDGCVLLDVALRRDVKPERRRIGYVFQDAKLFPHLDVAGNLRYAARRARSPEVVNFDAAIELLALGPLLARRTQQLSGGERQRVAIGRALLSQPRLLLLDEPLAALDAARREEVLPYLEALRDRLAVPMVYVSHQFDEVLRLATHLVLIDAGKTVAQGDLGAMSLRPELRAIIGADAVGSVLDGEVLGIDAASGLHRVRVGGGVLAVRAPAAVPGSRWRVQILARDVIVATDPPRSLSVRNELAGTIVAIVADEPDADLVSIDVGGVTILARITSAATRSLGLHAGMRVWALVKSVSLGGRSVGSAPLRDAHA
jgi:molybdate transport system ATP-binding protein